MKKLYLLLFIAITAKTFAQTNVGITGNIGGVYINEIHYDNLSTDVGEFIEIAGPSGTDLSTYVVSLYRNTGTVYGTFNLSGTIDDEGSGFGAILISPTSIQNGPADGISLSNGGTSVQLLSYDGILTATAGPANGLTSIDIGVSEDGTVSGGSLEYNETSMVWVEILDDTPGDFTQGPTLGINTDNISRLNIYPNPTAIGFVNIKANLSDIMTISVFDVLGKEVLNQVITDGRLNVSSLKSGVYIMRLTQDNNSVTKKLVIK